MLFTGWKHVTLEKFKCHVSPPYIFSRFFWKLLPLSLNFWGWNRLEGIRWIHFIPSHRNFFFRWSFYYTTRCETQRDHWEIILHVLCHRWRTEQSRKESCRVAQQPFKPPMNFSFINYDSGKCIGEYLRMSDNLKRNLGGFWHFPIKFREYYCTQAWLRNISVKTQKFQVKIVKIRN
jgi:hypothetical protein